MITFNYEDEFRFDNEDLYSRWISDIILSENKTEGDINYIFCNDEYLLNLNQQYLNHDTLTDIITFDYSVGNELHGDIFISVERVIENAADFNQEMDQELRRVVAHGVLHLCGYKDKTEEEEATMRKLEDGKLAMFHVKQ